MPNSSISNPNIATKILLALVDDTTPYRTHNAISIYSAVVLGLCTIVMTVAAIFMKKNLAYELFTLVSATAGLAGYQFGKAMTTSVPTLPPPTLNKAPNSPLNSSNNGNAQVVAKVGETTGDG